MSSEIPSAVPPTMELSLISDKSAILRGIAVGFNDSHSVMPVDDDSSEANLPLALRLVQQLDNQYIATDLGREVRIRLDASTR